MINKKITIEITLFSGLVSLAAAVLNHYKSEFINEYFFYAQYVYCLLCFGSIYLLGQNVQPGLDYINKFFIAKGLKIIFSAIIIILYIKLIQEDKICFIFNLFAIYLLYTAFEIKLLLTNLRAQNL